QPPLTQPEGVLARQQSVAEIVPQPGVERALVVVAGIVLENMFDVRRIRQEKSVVGASLHMDDVAVAVGGVEKRADRTRTEVRENPDNRITARTGRKHRQRLF